MEKRRLTGRIAFLARLDVLKEKIDAGYSVTVLHDEYGKELGIGYGQLRNYVNQYIRRKQDESQGKNPATPNVGSRDKRAVRTRTPGQPAFVSSDTPRDDLIKPKE